MHHYKGMDLEAIIAELRGELEHIDRAIESLERFARTGEGSTRGRPPKSAKTPYAHETLLTESLREER